MLKVQYKRLFFTITEIINGNTTNNREDVKTDILVEMELLSSPTNSLYIGKEKGTVSLIIPNYLIDLRLDEKDMYNGIHKNARYKINRAKNRDQLNYYELDSPTDEDIEKFSSFYNPFARTKNIRECDVNKLKSIRDQNSLIISYITDCNDTILCYHVHFLDRIQAYLLYSASHRENPTENCDRNLIGRANRYLHWMEILSFKQKGYRWYNFGGKIVDPEDIRGQNVNKFKMEFGTITGYDARTYTSKSVLGKLGLFLLKVKWKKNHEFAYSKEILGQSNKEFRENSSY